ncbi:hypothetical protein DK26_19375 [Bosea sp. WAO]|nr:hypothetical protein DK26_19375 [Bosea sp. WAO]
MAALLRAGISVLEREIEVAEATFFGAAHLLRKAAEDHALAARSGQILRLDDLKGVCSGGMGW